MLVRPMRLLLVLIATLALTAMVRADERAAERQTGWKSFVTARQVHERLSDPNLLIIDVRKSDEYAKGHIPGAINIPGGKWRTPDVKPGEGPSQDLFLLSDGRTPDVAKYEKLLGEAGVKREHKIVVYGSHAGRADGSVPAMILNFLGHGDVAFLDGMGMSEWYAAGYPDSKEPRTLPPSTYKASPQPGVVWNTDDVLKNLENKEVVFYDTRSPKEFTGEDLRGNKRGGHIPGAVLCNYEDLLTKDNKTVLPPVEVKKKLEERNITPDKTVVLYCQTATRVSLPALAMKDLGYTDVAIYDASMFEYANREDTPLATPTGGEKRDKTPEKPKADK
jgi:thiosulfate/3-mercaptopyruvate sulfurtransferase